MVAQHVLLVRHGQTALNAAGRLRGRLDPPLDQFGKTQALELAQQLAQWRPVRVVSSPLQRAVQTALPLCQHTNVPLTVDPRLADRDYGRWAGEEVQGVLSRFGSLEDAPGVEPRESVLARVRAVLEEQRPFLAGGPIVLVAHEVINRMLLGSLDIRLGDPDGIPQHTACWNVLTADGEGWRVDQVDKRANTGERFD